MEINQRGEKLKSEAKSKKVLDNANRQISMMLTAQPDARGRCER